MSKLYPLQILLQIVFLSIDETYNFEQGVIVYAIIENDDYLEWRTKESSLA